MVPTSLARSVLLIAFVLAAAQVHAAPPLVLGEAPMARVSSRVPTPDLDVSASETVTRQTLSETGTVSIRIDNASVTVHEALLEVTLPADALVSRLSLKVDAQWMEAEVLPRAAAQRIYQTIVHPDVGPRRDPALLVELAPGRWSLDVFPIPAHGRRELELVWHRLRPGPDGRATQRVERRLVPTGGAETVFALAPAREAGLGRAGRDALPLERLVIAVDTSLSIGDAGLAGARVIATQIAASLRVETFIVSGDRQASAPCKVTCTQGDAACASSVEACLAGPVGGASDLGLLLTAAGAAMQRGPARRAALVLLSDGQRTAGATATELATAAATLAARLPVTLFTVPIGDLAGPTGRPFGDRDAGLALLHALAESGHGALFQARDGEDLASLVRAIAAPRRADLSVRALAGELGPWSVRWVDERPIVLGTMRSDKAEIEVTWADDKGQARSRFTLERASGPVRYGLFQELGRALVAQHERRLDLPAIDLARLAREHGVAGPYGSLLALETEADYQRRGIARVKAFELASARGEAVAPIAARALADEDALRVDGDGDGVPDAEDRCPTEPETMNGVNDSDGCPDRAFVRIESSEIRILDRVYFEPGQRTLAPRSAPLLDAVAAVMRDNSWIGVVEIGGHCDRREARAKALSLARAEAVRRALVARGVEPERLVVSGYGAERPIDANDQAEGRARNRRTEFVILVARGELVAGGATPQSIAALVARMALPPREAHRREASLLLAAGFRDAAAVALTAALALTPPEAQLALFDVPLAEAFPDRYAEVGLARLRAGTDSSGQPGSARPSSEFAMVAPRAFWSEALPRLLPSDAPLATQAMRRYLATRTPSVRRHATRADLLLEARLLDAVGEPLESLRRASEVLELGLEP